MSWIIVILNWWSSQIIQWSCITNVHYCCIAENKERNYNTIGQKNSNMNLTYMSIFYFCSSSIH